MQVHETLVILLINLTYSTITRMYLVLQHDAESSRDSTILSIHWMLVLAYVRSAQIAPYST